jgi:hypothetical protein
MEDEIVAETLVTRDGEIASPRIREAMGLQQPASSAAS